MLRTVFVGCFWNRDSLPDPRPVFPSDAVVASQREDRDPLFDVIQFGSQGQELRFTSDLARMLGIQGNASEVMANP
jgi:hypothetical protein